MFQLKNRYLYIALLAGYSFINIKFTEGDDLITFPVSNWTLLIVISWLVILVWESNRGIANWLSKNSNIRTPLRLIRQFGVSILLMMAITLVSVLLLGSIFSVDAGILEMKLLFGFNFRVNLFLHCINAIMVYNLELGSSRMEAEQLKIQTTEARLQALRNQIQPHFLFNSFNVLTVLIETNPEVAVKFLEQLSSVYRYLLRTQDTKLVKLEEEVDFLNSYIYLISMRFQDTLTIDFQPVNGDKYFIPPSTLQLLIENAIKHNEASKLKPLSIKIYREGQWLLVHNNRNPKRTTEDSSKVGLANIKSRYKLLGNESPEVIQEDHSFTVKVPLITAT